MRPDFSMTMYSGQLAMCDVCTEYIGNDEPRLRTFIGTTAQSDVCMGCARLISDRIDNDGQAKTAQVAADRWAAARAAKAAKRVTA